MHKIKLIALDLDGTLLDSAGKLSNSNKTSIKNAIAKGVRVVIASGRPYGSLPKEVLEMRGIEYAITSNGAAVYHILKQKEEEKYAVSDEMVRRVKEYLLSAAAVESILDVTDNMDVVYETFIDGIAYADENYVMAPVRYGASEQAVPYIQRTRIPVKDMISFMKEHICELDSIDIVVKNERLKNRVQNKLKDVDEIYITSSVKQLIEISNKGAGKHSGLRFLGTILNIRLEEMAAVGNDRNDIDMMSCVGVGIAVANASKECLNVADVIVKSNDENGVAEAINILLSL